MTTPVQKKPKLSASNVLITPEPQPCMACAADTASATLPRDKAAQPPTPTYFAVLGTFIVRPLCPAHLAPQMRRGSYEALMRQLYSVVYMHVGTKLFEPQRAAWEALLSNEARWERIGKAIHERAQEAAHQAVQAMTLPAASETTPTDRPQ